MKGDDIASEAADRSAHVNDDLVFAGRVDRSDKSVILAAKVNEYDNAVLTATAGDRLVVDPGFDGGNPRLIVTGDTVTAREDFERIEDARGRARSLAARYDLDSEADAIGRLEAQDE